MMMGTKRMIAFGEGKRGEEHSRAQCTLVRRPKANVEAVVWC